MSVIEKARELADAIAESEELAQLRLAEIAIKNDPQAREILLEFQQKQQEIYSIQMKGQELSEEQKKQVEVIENKMEGNPLIMNYAEKQHQLEQMLRSINFLISKALSGDNEEGCNCSSGDCGTGNCSSCC